MKQQERLFLLRGAAHTVINRWESGDLAEAVTVLGETLEAIEEAEQADSTPSQPLNPEAEFEQWYDAEIADDWTERHSTTRDVARLAFLQGFALAQEGRA